MEKKSWNSWNEYAKPILKLKLFEWFQNALLLEFNRYIHTNCVPDCFFRFFENEESEKLFVCETQKKLLPMTYETFSVRNANNQFEEILDEVLTH